jgi:hypothetical protein
MKISNFEPTYRLDYGGGDDLSWKTLANVTLGTGLFVGVNFEVRILDAQNNWGISTDARQLRYYVYMARSGGSQDDVNPAAQVSGPIADYVRVVKTSTGQYELQIRQIQNWQRLKFEVSAYAINSLGSGGSVAYVDNPSAGSSSGTIYNPSALHSEYLTNLSVTGTGTIGGVKLLNNGNTDPGNIGPSVQSNGAALYLEPSNGDYVAAGNRHGNGLIVGFNGGAGNLYASGNLGVGTTSPGAKVEIQADNPEYFLGFKDTHSGGSQWSFVNGATYSYGGGHQGDLIIGLGQPGSTFSDRLTIKSAGNIGVGTISPGYKLDVNGEVNASGLRINGSAIASSQWSSGSGSIAYTGNVGIGTATPNSGSKLDVRGGVSVNQTQSTTQRGAGVDIGWTGSGNADVYFGDYTNGWAIGENPDASMRIFKTSGATLSSTPVTIQAGGNVGIGTASPQGKLHVANGTTGTGILIDGFTPATNPTIANNAGNEVTFRGSGGNTENGIAYNFVRYDTAASFLAITNSGKVGIGNSSPQYRLDVSGTAHVTSNLTVDGNISAKYQDVAEWVPASEQLSAGTVVVLDSTKSNQVTSSSVSYDTRVAGVISEQPGIALGEKSEGKVLVATTGRVRVKVDATKGPIHVGDLLVTSDISGVAMKSEAINLGGVQFHRPGTLIGKALEPLEKGKGEILVLLSLQ